MQAVFIIQSYRNTSRYLAGTDKDRINLENLGYKLIKYSGSGVTCAFDTGKEDILALLRLDSNLIWICGHGMLTSNGLDNIFLIEESLPSLSSFGHISSFDFSTTIHFNQAPLTVFVLDFCHASSLVNLKYYYEDTGTWAKKMINKFPDIWDDNPQKICIVIAGASDYDSALEDSNGGYLTNYILQLLERFRYVSLELFIKNKPQNVKSVISLNRQIPTDLPLISL